MNLNKNINDNNRNILLTIAIPTFERRLFLEKSLKSLESLSGSDNIEILIIDNHSSDNTFEWLCQAKKRLNITVKQNPINLGIEGNIICALLHAKGNYVWLLSDHTCVNASEVTNFVNKIENGLKFTFGYAKATTYPNILPESYIPFKLSKLNQKVLGKLIFYMGNISTFIINKSYFNKYVRTFIRFSGYSYPQLGGFVHINKNDTFIEVPSVSYFIDSHLKELKSYRISYDWFRSRFIGFARAVDEITRLNSNLKNINHYALKDKVLIKALIRTAIGNLCWETDYSIKPYEYAFCLSHYYGYIQFFLLGCIFVSSLPEKFRLIFCRNFFKIFFPNHYKNLELFNKSIFYSEVIKE